MSWLNFSQNLLLLHIRPTLYLRNTWRSSHCLWHKRPFGLMHKSIRMSLDRLVCKLELQRLAEAFNIQPPQDLQLTKIQWTCS